MQFCAEKHGWTKFVSMQNHYSLLYREEEREMNRFCDETGVGLIPVSLNIHSLMNWRQCSVAQHRNHAVILKIGFTLLTDSQWAPLCRGHLARPASVYGETLRSEGEKAAGGRGTGAGEEIDLKIIERVEEIAKKRGWKMSQIALAWINKRVSSPIVGFSSIERMDEAIASGGKTLTEEEEKYLEELYKPKPIAGHA